MLIVNLICKEISDFANQQYKYCDTYEGTCQLLNVVNVLQISFLLTFKMKSPCLVKNGEVANHTRIRVNHPKYKVFYKQNVQRPYISFLNNAFMSLQDL